MPRSPRHPPPAAPPPLLPSLKIFTGGFQNLALLTIQGVPVLRDRRGLSESASLHFRQHPSVWIHPFLPPLFFPTYEKATDGFRTFARRFDQEAPTLHDHYRLSESASLHRRQHLSDWIHTPSPPVFPTYKQITGGFLIFSRLTFQGAPTFCDHFGFSESASLHLTQKPFGVCPRPLTPLPPKRPPVGFQYS